MSSIDRVAKDLIKHAEEDAKKELIGMSLFSGEYLENVLGFTRFVELFGEEKKRVAEAYRKKKVTSGLYQICDSAIRRAKEDSERELKEKELKIKEVYSSSSDRKRLMNELKERVRDEYINDSSLYMKLLNSGENNFENKIFKRVCEYAFTLNQELFIELIGSLHEGIYKSEKRRNKFQFFKNHTIKPVRQIALECIYKGVVIDNEEHAFRILQEYGSSSITDKSAKNLKQEFYNKLVAKPYTKNLEWSEKKLESIKAVLEKILEEGTLKEDELNEIRIDIKCIESKLKY